MLHVDLSVVPDAYFEFASQYPNVVNGQVKDIRKSTFSKNLLKQSDRYRGKVILKTDANYAGWPEKLASNNLFTLVLSRMCSRLRFPFNNFSLSSDYKVFDLFDDVPLRYRHNPNFVIEKFCPEKEDGYYVVHMYIFLGGVHHGFKECGREPVVKAESIVSSELEIPHPDIVALRKQLGFDYGKFDYTIVDNKPVLLDINKTFGTPTGLVSEKYEHIVRHRARGLYDYFFQSGQVRFDHR